MDLNDVAYAQVAEVLFGDGAYELIAKKSAEEKRREKRQAQVALGGNVLGLTAGGAALYTAGKNPALRRKGATPKNAGPVTSRLTRYAKTPYGRGRLIQLGAAGAVGLQAANTIGDVAGNIVLRREVKKSSPDMADLHAHGSDKPQKKYLTRGSLTLMAAEKTGPVVVRSAKATGKGAKWAGSKAEPVLVDTGRKIKEKVGKTWDGSDGSSLPPLPVPPSMSSGPDPHELDLTWTGEFSKRDDDKRQVFGWASITEVNGEPVVDLQGDYITTEEIEKAAYDYVQKSRKGGDMHRRNGDQPHHVSDMIESFVVTDEKKKQMGLPDSVPTGWWVGFQVHDDETWDLVKKDKRKGFSIHGKGKRVTV